MTRHVNRVTLRPFSAVEEDDSEPGEWDVEAECLALEYRPNIWKQVPFLLSEDLSEICREYPDYARVSNLGNGWVRVSALSELILTVEINGQEYQLCVGKFFKWQLGRLTKQRQQRLIATMPRKIRVREDISPQGQLRFLPEPGSLQAWMDHAFDPIAA